MDAAVASTTNTRLSREDWKKAKELEKARKDGTAPAEVDEDGKEINPHIPQYIRDAPWYLNKSAPSLKHQRAFQSKPQYADVKEWYSRGETAGEAATKYRKGSCTNCGAMTHSAKFCVERPRKIGAKWTGKDIKPDEVIQELQLDYDGKRDRWNGYDPSTYQKIVEQYELIDEERKKKKKEESLQNFMTEPDPSQNRYPHSSSSSTTPGDPTKTNEEEESDSEDEDLIKDGKEDFIDTTAQPIGVKTDAKTRTTVRNLRIREDTAKYLRNLDINSAYYDPKSRSMRENPNPNAKSEDQSFFIGDNFVRQSGDTQKFFQIQTYAWDSTQKGSEIHLQASPSQAELLFKQFKQTKEELHQVNRDKVLQRYVNKSNEGNEDTDHLKKLQASDKPPSDDIVNHATLLAQTEEYVEYARDGSILRENGSTTKNPAALARSKYEEDVLLNNHTRVWGSYWEDGRWGYKCCHQLLKHSYCTGKAGIEASQQIKQDELERLYGKSTKDSITSQGNEENTNTSAHKDKKKNNKSLEDALKEEDERRREEKDERKRKYNSFESSQFEPTTEELEAFHMKKKMNDDPMAKFLNK